MDSTQLGKELLELCKSAENKFIEVNGLLEGLTDENHRRGVLSHQDKVSLELWMMI